MVLGFVASLVMLGDQNRIKQLLIGHVEYQTGRKLSIDGEVSIRLFPRLRIEARQIRLSGPDSFPGPDFLVSDMLRAEVRLLPLLQGRVETSEMMVQGARVNLLVDSSGAHSFGGLLRRSGRQGAPGILSTGPLRLEGIELQIGQFGIDRNPSIQVERVELDGLSFDRALGLNFQGAIGRPALLEDVKLTGLLFVPAASGSFRLVDMKLSARLAGAKIPFDLLGVLSFSAVPPLAMKLEAGRLMMPGAELAVNGLYESRERPYFFLDLVGDELDGAELLSMLVPDVGPTWFEQLDAWVAEHDFELSFNARSLLVGGYPLGNPRLNLTSSDGQARLVSAVADLPGALLTLDSELRVAETESELRFEALLDVDNLAKLLAAGSSGLLATGAGTIRIRPGPENDPDALAEIDLVLLDGTWPGLGALREAAGLGDGEQFEIMEARLLLYPEAIGFPTLLLRLDGHLVELNGLLLRESGLLSGTVTVLPVAGPALRLRMTGTSERPQFNRFELDSADR